jgi:transcription initiation factor TFIID subunit 12
VPPPNPPTSATATVTPPTSVSPTPNAGTASNPAQTLATPAPSPAATRPPAPRMRPPYTHLASPITMSSPSAPATSGTSASLASIPASSPVTSAAPRGGVAIGVPALRPTQTPVGYTGFVPPPSLAHQFGSMHRGPDQPPSSSAQVCTSCPFCCYSWLCSLYVHNCR